MPNKQRLEAAGEWVAKRSWPYVDKGVDLNQAYHAALLEYVVELEERLERRKDAKELSGPIKRPMCAQCGNLKVIVKNPAGWECPKCWKGAK